MSDPMFEERPVEGRSGEDAQTEPRIDVNSFEQLRIGLATADDIRNWSRGEVKKPETINYRTLRPERDGLFCEKIFGPERDWECYCGKYKRVRFKGVICEKCGVEVTRSKVRRERMGHIELASPVVHIWFLRGTRSWLAYLLGGLEPRDEIKAKQLDKVIYFSAWLVSSVDAEKRDADMPILEQELFEDRETQARQRDKELKQRQKDAEAELRELEASGAKDTDIRAKQKLIDRDLEAIKQRHDKEIELMDRAHETFLKMHPRMIVEDEELWREIHARYAEYYVGGTGSAAIKSLIDAIDFQAEELALREAIANGLNGKPLSAQRREKAIKRLKIIASFNRTDDNGRLVNNPRAMVLDVLPVIPPDLRPMVQLDGGRFATSDLNDLYRRVINRNNRLRRMLEIGAPEIIVNNEKRMLQEAVDALFDNGRRGRPVTGPGNRPLKSLSDMLKGKQGRFRQNLLGKRVDYSGRSVIVVGPTLRLHQCGLPKLMALELFKPFVMKRLVDRDVTNNIKSAKRMVERRDPRVWDVLEYVIREHPVLLNRAPTLHRLGIQAFEPVLVEGKAIQLHPLVCPAFNADFDGDQMAVHLPLSVEAQGEARVLMLSANNILSPASGRPVVTPQQDLVIGGYYLSGIDAGATGEGRVFRNMNEVHRAVDDGVVSIRAMIKWSERDESGATRYVDTTPGRLILEELLPTGYVARFGHISKELTKGEFDRLVDRLSEGFSKAEIANTLDEMKELCYRYASRSGLTISVDDIRTPSNKKEILDRYEKEAEKIETQFRRGIIIDRERRQQEVRLWMKATTEVQDALEQESVGAGYNPVAMMIDSGARGKASQLRQIAAMRGLVANPRGDMIPRPIKNSFREGFETLEYFIATPGARKGLVDTALRTADAGYLTRRLHDVAQELIIRREDCGTTLGVWVDNVKPDTPNTRGYLETKLFGRALLNDVTLADGTVLAANSLVSMEDMNALRDDPTIDRVRVRSVLTCDAESGVCALCYGRSLATGSIIELGEAVGVIAAQSIGEPGTQLTMRTFHTGGVADEKASDVVGGLPRVVELFEARDPRNSARLARVGGVVRIADDEGKGIVLRIVDDQGGEHETLLPERTQLRVTDGSEVKVGDPLTEGPFNPKELMETRGPRETQVYLVEEVQIVYRKTGVQIHDKHIELIVRQMTRRVRIHEPGDTSFLPGEKVDRKVFRDVNQEMVESGKRPAEGRPELMGITKASLATDSWLSAASFQETTRVLTEAAIDGRSDNLVGLKENIIIGKLIPAGTGMEHYRDFAVDAPFYVPMEYYSSDEDTSERLAADFRAGFDAGGAEPIAFDLPSGPVESADVEPASGA